MIDHSHLLNYDTSTEEETSEPQSDNEVQEDLDLSGFQTIVVSSTNEQSNIKKRIFQNQNCLDLFHIFLFSDLVDLPEIIDVKDEDDNDEEIVTKNTNPNVQTDSFKTISEVSIKVFFNMP
jgi:hypothetical protein